MSGSVSVRQAPGPWQRILGNWGACRVPEDAAAGVLSAAQCVLSAKRKTSCLQGAETHAAKGVVDKGEMVQRVWHMAHGG